MTQNSLFAHVMGYGIA